MLFPDPPGAISALGAPELLAGVLESSTEGVTVLTLGPLTNIADMLTASPDAVGAIDLVFTTGGALEVPGSVAGRGNFSIDPEAARIVFESGALITLVPRDVAGDASFVAGLATLLGEDRSRPAHGVLAEMIAGNPGLMGQEFVMWDPVTAAVLVAETLAVFEMRTVDVIGGTGPDAGPWGPCRDDRGQSWTYGPGVRHVGSRHGCRVGRRDPGRVRDAHRRCHRWHRGPTPAPSSRTGAERGSAWRYPPTVIYSSACSRRRWALVVRWRTVGSGQRTRSRCTARSSGSSVSRGTAKDRWRACTRGLSSTTELSTSAGRTGRPTPWISRRVRRSGHFRLARILGSPISSLSSDHAVFFRERDGFGIVLIAVERKTGTELWRFLPPDGETRVRNPVFAGGVVYTGTSDFFYALDAETGEELWRFRPEGGAPGPAAPAIVVDGVAYFGTPAALLYAVDIDSHEELWAFQAGSSGFGVASVPRGRRRGGLFRKRRRDLLRSGRFQW